MRGVYYTTRIDYSFVDFNIFNTLVYSREFANPVTSPNYIANAGRGKGLIKISSESNVSKMTIQIRNYGSSNLIIPFLKISSLN